jgi:hypothetical protein
VLTIAWKSVDNTGSMSDPTHPSQTSDIAALLAQAAKVAQQAAKLAATGRVTEALDLDRQADALRQKAREVAAEPVAEVSRDDGSDRAQSARAMTIAALGEIGVPSSPRAIAEYAWARFRTRLDYRGLASLRRDEWRAWSSPRSSRAVYLVPALEGQRFLAVRGKLALSDWPLERRLIGPWSERADHLVATLHLAKQLEWLSRIDPAGAEGLRTLVRLHAATVSGVPHERDAVDAHQIQHAIEAELAVIGDRDIEWRTEAAQRAVGFLTEEQQLWGAALPRIVHRSA